MEGDSTVTRAWTLTRTEIRTFLRHLRDSTRQFVSTVVMVLGFSLVALSTYSSTTAYGEQLANGTVPSGLSGAVVCSVFGLAGYVGFAGGFNQARVGAVGPLIRTSMTPTAVSLGRFFTRTLQSLGILGPIALSLLVLVTVGAGDVVVTAGVVLAYGLPFATGLVVGRVFGDVARYLNERLQLSLWVKAGFTVGLMAVVFVLVQALFGAQFGTDTALGEFQQGQGVQQGAIFPGTPMQAYASTILAPFGGTPDPLGAVVVVLLVAGFPLGLLSAVRLETVILTRDLGSDAAPNAHVDESVGVPTLFDLTPATRMAWRYLLRTRRDPRMLAHLTPLLFGVLSMGVSAVRDPGIVLTAGPPAAVVGGGVLAGAAYCLNPLGDERDQLPLLLSSTPSFAVLLRARMIAGLVLGLTVGVGIGTPLAVFNYGPGFVLGQSLLAVVLAAATTGIAVGLGAVVPKFEKQEYMNVKRAQPSTVVLLGLFAGGLVVGGLGFVLLLATTVDPSATVAVGWVVYLGILCLSGLGGYRYAVGRTDRFRVDQV